MVETQLWSESQKAGKYDCVSAAQIRGLYQRHSGNRYTFGSDSWRACGALGDDEFEELCRIKENQYSDFF